MRVINVKKTPELEPEKCRGASMGRARGTAFQAEGVAHVKFLR